MRTSIYGSIAAIAAGAVLAAIPLFALERALDTYLVGQAQERLEARAHGSLAFAEGKLSRTVAVLAALAERRGEECGSAALDAMRVAVFTQSPLKAVMVLDQRGRPVCTHIGDLAETYSASREYPLPDDRFSLSIARFRDRDERMLHLRFERANGRSLSAFVAANTLLPDGDLDANSASRRLKLMLAGGELIDSRMAVEGLNEGGSITERETSQVYPIAIVAERNLSAIASDYSELRFVARIGAALALIFAMAAVCMLLRRNRNDAVARLRHAIESGEIVPYFQPTVDLKTGRVRGAEVLARWRRSDGTIAPPAEFISLAEQSGLIFDLTRSLMKRARDEVGAAHAERPHLRMAFNLFAGHVADTGIVDDVKAIFEGTPIEPEQLILEVTERTPLSDLRKARQVIEELQRCDIKVAIDDVGTGHGGLSYLLKLGVDIIKIDKMFIDAISTERYSHTIIETLVELARSMQMEVIAEGVETLEQVEYLRAKGVDQAQGYVFAPPLPASSYIALIAAMERPRLRVVPSSRRDAMIGAA